MANNLDKWRGKSGSKGKNLVSAYAVGPIRKPAAPAAAGKKNAASLPLPAAIYASAAAIFAVITVFYLFKGSWITGGIMIVPTCCLGGFAWHSIHSDEP